MSQGPPIPPGVPPQGPPPEGPPQGWSPGTGSPPPGYGNGVPPNSGLSSASLIVGICAFIGGIIPYVGFLGVVAVVLGVADHSKVDPPGQPKRHGQSTGGIVLGALATVGAIVWISFLNSLSHGSCPHLYAFDGERYRLDADLASGALYRGAERDDQDRLEFLREVNGEYRVRLQDDLEEVDNIDSLALVVVDAPPDVEVLPTEKGDVVGARDLEEPAKRDFEASVAGSRDPREARTLTFGRPSGDRALLVLRGRSTAFAEDAFVRYMAKIGQGSRAVLEYETDKDCPCSRELIAEETERLGFPLWITVSSDTGAPRKYEIGPIGPAISRSVALPIELPVGEHVTVRLESTPRFWEIDDVALAAPAEIPEPRLLTPASASARGGDVTRALQSDDRDRLVLHSGEYADVRFVAPPATAGAKRTVIARLRGYYEMDIGGVPGVDASRMLAHELGWISLPRFAQDLR